MSRYEYCLLTTNFAQGTVKATYMKPDGAHIEQTLWEGTMISVDEQAAIRHRLIAQLGEDGWLLSSILDSSKYYFMRLIEKTALESTASYSPEGKNMLSLDRETNQLQIGNERVRLQPTEARLIAYFLDNPNRAISPLVLLQTVWEYPPDTGDPDLVRAYVRNLNAKTERYLGDGKSLIRTINGVGYMLTN